MKRPVIIDTDLTFDDIAALRILAQNGKIEIKAVTTVGRDVRALCSTAQELCRRNNMHCTVAKGAEKPVFKDNFPTCDIYGNTNICGDTQLGCDNGTDFKYAWDVIFAQAQRANGQLEILTLGPLTNIAVALLRYPDIKPLIKHIFIAAGANYIGNIAPYSEYNAFCDPDALQIVIDSGVPVTLFPLDTAIDKAESQTDKGYAAAAATAFANPCAMQTKDYYVKCETRSGENQGWTIIDRLGKYKKEPNLSVVTEVVRQMFEKQ